MKTDARSEARRLLLETPAGELARGRIGIQEQAERAGFSAAEIQRILNERPDLPRELLPEEREALLLSFQLLAPSTRQLLRAQVATARVSAYDCPCPCASVALVVDRDLVTPVFDVENPLWDVHVDGPGEVSGGVMVWFDHGYLSGIEVFDHYGGPITAIPPREWLSLGWPQRA